MEVCNDLVQLARKRGGPDNITVLYKFFASFQTLDFSALAEPAEFPSLD